MNQSQNMPPPPRPTNQAPGFSELYTAAESVEFATDPFAFARTQAGEGISRWRKNEDGSGAYKEPLDFAINWTTKLALGDELGFVAIIFTTIDFCMALKRLLDQAMTMIEIVESHFTTKHSYHPLLFPIQTTKSQRGVFDNMASEFFEWYRTCRRPNPNDPFIRADEFDKIPGLFDTFKAKGMALAKAASEIAMQIQTISDHIKGLPEVWATGKSRALGTDIRIYLDWKNVLRNWAQRYYTNRNSIIVMPESVIQAEWTRLIDTPGIGLMHSAIQQAD